MMGRMTIRVVPVVLALGLAGTPVAAAPGQADPSVTVDALDTGGIHTFTDCANTPSTEVSEANLAVVRSGATTDPLDVSLTYGGTLTPGTDYEALPSSVTIPAGVDRQFLRIVPSKAGTIVARVAPGSGYAVGAASEVTLTISSSTRSADCLEATTQTVVLGSAPVPVDVYGRAKDGSAVADTVLTIKGDLPPGLTYENDGSWSGTATAVGTFSFTAQYCVGGQCVVEVPVTIVVVAKPEPAPAPAPEVAPQAPVALTPHFTG